MDLNVNLSGMAVAIGMPIYGGIPADTAMSLFKTAQQCAEFGVKLDFINVAAPYVHISRDWIVDEFLKGQCQKLVFIDHDESWEPEDFGKLLALSTVRDVVGATYPAKRDGPPTFYIDWLADAKVEEFGLIKVGGMGLGFTAIDRGVLQRLTDKAPRMKHPTEGHTMASIFRVDTVGDCYRGEDIAFYADVRAMGVDVWLDPNIVIGHIGQKQWRGRVSDALQPKEVKAA